MSMSTSLDDLQSGGSSTAGPVADEERVKRILAEMNAGDIVQAPPVQQQQQQIITEPPIAMSTGQLRMDPGTARAHVIGNSQPTMADFQSMFAQASPGMAPFHGPAVVHGPVLPPPAKPTSWKATVANQLKGPVAVAIIIFLLNLPVVTSILSRYASWMYLSSGEISVSGLLVKALLAAFLFALYQGASMFIDK
jgi:hypothetical protein